MSESVKSGKFNWKGDFNIGREEIQISQNSKLGEIWNGGSLPLRRGAEINQFTKSKKKGEDFEHPQMIESAFTPSP
jgi:hypothetical protein